MRNSYSLCENEKLKKKQISPLYLYCLITTTSSWKICDGDQPVQVHFRKKVKLYIFLFSMISKNFYEETIMRNQKIVKIRWSKWNQLIICLYFFFQHLTLWYRLNEYKLVLEAIQHQLCVYHVYIISICAIIENNFFEIILNHKLFSVLIQDHSRTSHSLMVDE